MRYMLRRTPVTAAEAAAEEAALELPPAPAAAALACLNAVRAPSLPSILPLSRCGFFWVEQEASVPRSRRVRRQKVSSGSLIGS